MNNLGITGVLCAIHQVSRREDLKGFYHVWAQEPCYSRDLDMFEIVIRESPELKVKNDRVLLNSQIFICLLRQLFIPVLRPKSSKKNSMKSYFLAI